MNKHQIQQLFSTLFLVFFLSTIVVYFATGKNMTYTWIMASIAIVCYFIYRFFKR